MLGRCWLGLRGFCNVGYLITGFVHTRYGGKERTVCLGKCKPGAQGQQR